MTLNQCGTDGSFLVMVLSLLEMLGHQKPKLHLAKKSQARFTLQKGCPISISLRFSQNEACHILNKLIRLVLPYKGNFKGIQLKSLDKEGNLSMQLENMQVFFEVESEHQQFMQSGSATRLPIGLSFQTTCTSSREAEVFFSAFQLPFFN